MNKQFRFIIDHWKKNNQEGKIEVIVILLLSEYHYLPLSIYEVPDLFFPPCIFFLMHLASANLGQSCMNYFATIFHLLYCKYFLK